MPQEKVDILDEIEIELLSQIGINGDSIYIKP